MNLQILSYFQELAEQGNLERAASNLEIDPKLLERKINELEKELGRPCFEVNDGNYSLNNVGAELYKFSNSANDTTRTFGSSLKKRLSQAPYVQLSLNACTSLLHPIYKSFQALHSEVELHITQNANMSDLCDYYIVTSEYPMTDDCSTLLCKEPLCLLVNRFNPLASRSSIDISDLEGEPLIIQNRSNILRKIIERHFYNAGISPRITIETDSNMTISRAVDGNSAVAIIPMHTSASITGGQSVKVAFSNPDICRYLILKWNHSAYIDEKRKIVKDFLLDFFANIPNFTNSVEIQTFGYFTVKVHGKAVSFSSKKAKELLALLVDRRGASVTMEQAIDILWEDIPYDEKAKRRYRSVIIGLRESLKQAGIDYIVTFQRGSTHLNIDLVHCDLFEFYNNVPGYINSFSGEYLMDFSWAEMRIPVLYQRVESAQNNIFTI